MRTTLQLESHLSASPEVVWAWMTSLEGISKEMAPWLRMSAPRGVHSIAGLAFQPGVPLFRSWICLFGVLPVDFSDLTLLSLTPGQGLVEQSHMGSMRFWRHERSIRALGTGCAITDTLTFEPRWGGPLLVAFVRWFFAHRHKQLRRYLA